MENVKRFVDAHVIYCQTSLVEELLKNEILINTYPFRLDNEILEWWLVTPWLAEKLDYECEVVIEDYSCHWWGRQCSGASYLYGFGNNRNMPIIRLDHILYK